MLYLQLPACISEATDSVAEVSSCTSEERVCLSHSGWSISSCIRWPQCSVWRLPKDVAMAYGSKRWVPKGDTMGHNGPQVKSRTGRYWEIHFGTFKFVLHCDPMKCKSLVPKFQRHHMFREGLGRHLCLQISDIQLTDMSQVKQMTQASKTTTWIQEQPRKKYPMPALPPLSSHTQIELGPAGLFSDICVFGCVWPIRRAPLFRIFRGFWKFRTQLCSKLIQMSVATDSLSVSFTISFTRTPPGFSIRAAVAGDNRIPLALAMVQVSHLCWHPAACVQLSKISPGCCGALIVGSTMKIQSKHINWNFQLPDLKGKNNYPTYQNDFSLKEVDLWWPAMIAGEATHLGLCQEIFCSCMSPLQLLILHAIR